MGREARRHLLSPGDAGRQSRELVRRALEWNVLTFRLMTRARSDREAVGAASFDYLMYSGYVMMAHHWAQMARRAEGALATGSAGQTVTFYRSKQQLARFYFERLLPRADMHRRAALSPARTLTDRAPETDCDFRRSC